MGRIAKRLSIGLEKLVCLLAVKNLTWAVFFNVSGQPTQVDKIHHIYRQTEGRRIRYGGTCEKVEGVYIGNSIHVTPQVKQET